MLKKHPPTWLLLPVFTLLYFGAGKLGLSLAFLNVSASPVWPPTGLALAAILLLGYRLWPAIFLGAFVVNFTTTHEVTTSLLIAGGNTLEAVLGALLAQRFASSTAAFDHAPDIFRFVFFAAIPSTALSATVGVTSLAFAHSVPWQAFGPVWATWWIGDFVSDIVVAPVLIIWTRPFPAKIRPRTAWEAVFLTAVLMAVSTLIFGPVHIWDGTSYALAYLATPLLIWAAFRFQQRGASAAAFIMSILAVIGTLQHTGPFSTGSDNDSLLFLQSFMGVNTLTALLLAAVVAEHLHDRREKTLALERESAARAEAERANRTKDEFLAILSHELRTPLAPVLLTASLLENDPALPPHLRSDIHTIRHNVELEARLIEDLLDINRIAHGKLTLDLRTTDLHLVIRRALDICCHDRIPDLSIDLAAAHHCVRGDPARLQQIIWNLLNNAVKFTPAGNPISIHSSNPTDQLIRITVIDAGIGIDPAVIPRLFNAFEQADADKARQFGGLGLGLAITKSLVEAQAGTITATSAGRDQGATFTIHFPTVEAPIISAHPAPPAPNGAHHPSLQILLVEDHPATRQVMTRLLQDRGHAVTPVSTVQAALHAATQHPFNLVISDIGLPDGTGYDLMRQLRSSAPTPPRGIAVSGYGMNEDLRLSREAGFVAHLTKPIDLESLESAITRATTN